MSGSQTSILRVALLQITQSLSELLHWNVLVEREQMALSCCPGVIDEGVCVGGKTGDTHNDIT